MAESYREEQVRFESAAGLNLAGTLARPAREFRHGAVLGHCFTCSRHTRILIDLGRTLARSGFLALRFDFSGNGRSEGDFARSTYTAHIDEMKRAAAFVRERGADRVALIGHSMGAALALLTSARLDGVLAVVTLAGRYHNPDPQSLVDRLGATTDENGRVFFSSRGRDLALDPDFFHDVRRYDLPATVAGIDVPVLAVHGDRDRIMDPAEARHGAKLNPDRVVPVIVPDADHMFSQEAHRRRVAEQIVDWLTRAASETTGENR
jgi:putative redox protein